METSKILSADILDILFEGRNKDYGAYELRKTYNKRINYALVVTLLLCLLLFLTSIFASAGKKKQAAVVVADVSLENMKQEEKKPEPPLPPPPKQEPPKVEITKFTPPTIVKDEDVKEPPPAIEKLEETRIGTINQEGQKDENIVAPIVEQQGTGKVEAPKDAEDYDKVYTIVQMPAEFPGGIAAWNKYLERNLNSSVPVDNGAPSGRYTVVLSFIVDKNGNISDITAENDPKYGTKEEAIRVLKKGPSWKPAVQNGRNVIYRHRQSITFQVSDE